MFKSTNLLSLLFIVASICVQCGNIRNSDPVVAPVDLPPLVDGSPGESVLPSSAARSLYAETRRVVPETYFRNGKFEPLYAGAPFPISVETHVVRGGIVKVTLKAINIINYEITYNNADGWVSDVRPTGQTQHIGTPDQMATEAKLKNIIANSQQIAFEQDGRIQFITDDGTTRISFDRLIPDSPVAAPPCIVSNRGSYPSPPYYGTCNHFSTSSNSVVETRYVVPETYFRNGKFEPLYTGPPFPISVETHVVRGAFVKVTLRAINIISYEITCNNADGWVSDVRPTGQTQHTGTPDQMATEAQLKNIIANSQRIAFERDGRIQFITDLGNTRISFELAPHRYLAAVETRHVVPESYFHNGRFQILCDGQLFPITVETERRYGTSLIVTLKAVNIVQFEIMYNNSDGWVSNVKLLGETRIPGTAAEKIETELKVKNVIANCQQIAFEQDGRIQFISDNGRSRISFDRSHPHDLATVETRRVVPETYCHNGRFQPLYDGQPFPITVDAERRYGTSLIVTLKAVNIIQFEIMYNNSDVSNVKLLGETHIPGTPAEIVAVESKVKNIVGNCQQIAVEQNGRMSFVSDDGISHVSFDRLRGPVESSATPEVFLTPMDYLIRTKL